VNYSESFDYEYTIQIEIIEQDRLIFNVTGDCSGVIFTLSGGASNSGPPIDTTLSPGTYNLTAFAPGNQTCAFGVTLNCDVITTTETPITPSPTNSLTALSCIGAAISAPNNGADVLFAVDVQLDCVLTFEIVNGSCANVSLSLSNVSPTPTNVPGQPLTFGDGLRIPTGEYTLTASSSYEDCDITIEAVCAVDATDVCADDAEAVRIVFDADNFEDTVLVVFEVPETGRYGGSVGIVGAGSTCESVGVTVIDAVDEDAESDSVEFDVDAGDIIQFAVSVIDATGNAQQPNCTVELEFLCDADITTTSTPETVAPSTDPTTSAPSDEPTTSPSTSAPSMQPTTAAPTLQQTELSCNGQEVAVRWFDANNTNNTIWLVEIPVAGNYEIAASSSIDGNPASDCELVTLVLSDDEGNEVFRGFPNEVFTGSLEPGTYTLSIANATDGTTDGLAGCSIGVVMECEPFDLCEDGVSSFTFSGEPFLFNFRAENDRYLIDASSSNCTDVVITVEAELCITEVNPICTDNPTDEDVADDVFEGNLVFIPPASTLQKEYRLTITSSSPNQTDCTLNVEFDCDAPDPPTTAPTTAPSDEPTTSPSDDPTTSPTSAPSTEPTLEPTTASPTRSPTSTELSCINAELGPFDVKSNDNIFIHDVEIIVQGRYLFDVTGNCANVFFILSGNGTSISGPPINTNLALGTYQLTASAIMSGDQTCSLGVTLTCNITTESPTTATPTTDSPSTEPTIEPTSATASPSTEPTIEPTSATASPTNSPTADPTIEPVLSCNGQGATISWLGVDTFIQVEIPVTGYYVIDGSDTACTDANLTLSDDNGTLVLSGGRSLNGSLDPGTYTLSIDGESDPTSDDLPGCLEHIAMECTPSDLCDDDVAFFCPTCPFTFSGEPLVFNFDAEDDSNRYLIDASSSDCTDLVVTVSTRSSIVPNPTDEDSTDAVFEGGLVEDGKYRITITSSSPNQTDCTLNVEFDCDAPEPTTAPSTDPTTSPSTDPTTSPSTDPTTSPSTDPTTAPSDELTTAPSTEPTTAAPTNPQTTLSCNKQAVTAPYNGDLISIQVEIPVSGNYIIGSVNDANECPGVYIKILDVMGSEVKGAGAIGFEVGLTPGTYTLEVNSTVTSGAEGCLMGIGMSCDPTDLCDDDVSSFTFSGEPFVFAFSVSDPGPIFPGRYLINASSSDCTDVVITIEGFGNTDNPTDEDATDGVFEGDLDGDYFITITSSSPNQTDCTLNVEFDCDAPDPTTDPTTEPSMAPSAAPTFSVCTTDDALNIAFLMDESGSVSKDQWDLMVALVERVATYDVADTSYVSLFEFASLPTFTQFLDWTHVAFGKTAISNALNNNIHTTMGDTGTWDAVNRVLDEFQVYRENCGNGCDRRKDVLFLMTDGLPTTTGNANYRDVCPDLIPRVNSSNVDIVVIGVGDVSAFIDKVSCLDVRDDETEVYVVDDFNLTQFIELERKIREKTCSGLFPAGDSDRIGSPWTYEDGNSSLGPVPTTDPDGFGPRNDTAGDDEADATTTTASINPISAIISRVIPHKNGGDGTGARAGRMFGANALFGAEVDKFDLLNLWVMATVLIAVNVLLCLCCYVGRRCWMCREGDGAGKVDFDDVTDEEQCDEEEIDEIDF